MTGTSSGGERQGRSMQRLMVRSAHAKRMMQAGTLAVAKLGFGSQVRCEIIAGAARFAFTETWFGHRGRLVNRDWAALSAKFQNGHPKCFNAAIWHDTTLCGLAIGAVNQDRFVAWTFSRAILIRGIRSKGR